MSKHTPLPFKIEGYNKHYQRYEITDGKGTFIASVDISDTVHEDEGIANAEFIVKTCNSYYDMLEALETIANCKTPPITWEATGCLKKVREVIALMKG
jgi:hypothetical protein